MEVGYWLIGRLKEGMKEGRILERKGDYEAVNILHCKGRIAEPLEWGSK